MKSIGIVGTGIMGSGIAANFLKHDYSVFVWNKTADKVKIQGAVMCTTPREVTEHSEIVFEVTAHDESSRMAWLGDEGILAGASTNKVLIASSTLSIAWVDELVSLCKKRKLKFLDMAMTGSRMGAESGQLIFLAGGDPTVLDSIREDLKAISKEVIYFGSAGSGMRYKLILNMLQAIHIVGVGEALQLAKTVGLDVKKVGNALAEYPGGIITKRAWDNYQNPPGQVNFATKWIAKDLEYAKTMTGDKTTFALLESVLVRYQQALRDGFGDEDWTKVNA